ncbi:head-tail adaptor protein [Salipiger sp.]|uniref:head-tail adaptor protein n=1 Tax=Salipiger sp. TaxID=2078585 RepID=UPI003A972C96
MKRPNLNRILWLETILPTPDGAGGVVETWHKLGTLWAEITPRSGREITGEAGPLAVGTFRITVRAAPSGASNRPVAGQRFRLGDRMFSILAVSESDPAGMYLACDAREEVAA